MPWRETSPMEQRLDFVREYETELFTMTELAAQYGISRKTGYKWVERTTPRARSGLRDRSRRPHHSPQATDPELVEALVAQRRRHPRWGAKKLLAVAARHAARTPRGRVDRRSGRSSSSGAWSRPPSPARAAGRRAAPLAPITAVNEVWTTDFKGAVSHGRWRLLLSVDAARWLQSLRAALRCACPGPPMTRRGAGSSARLPTTACPSGFAATTGAPLRAPGSARLSRLSVWWMRLGSCPNGSRRAIPSKTGRMNSFIRC